MKTGTATTILLLAASTLSTLSAQNATFTRMDSIRARENGSSIPNPASGGLNLPQFSEIDLNGDADPDLFIFDRAGNTIATFLHTPGTGQQQYTYAPQYITAFPTGLKNFALLADYDCDGLPDIFTSRDEKGLMVYRNTSTGTNLSFAPAIDTVFTDLGAGPVMLLVSPKDIPALKDIDGDTDLDILTFDAGGSFLEWHRNMAIENQSTCTLLDLQRADACWGKFQESSLNQGVTLNITCRVGTGAGTTTLDARHAGSTVSAFDEENDGDMEVLLGDLIFDGITYLHNDGTNTAAHMDSADVNYPAEDSPVRLHIFPATYFIDVDRDGNQDLLVSPNADNISANYDNVWYYRNIDTNGGFRPEYNSARFLVDQMIDVGSAAAPVLFDHNGDGLLDLVIGNYSLKVSGLNNESGLTLYENTGTPTWPRYELITRDYKGISNLFNPAIFGMVPTFGDLDGDGDQDMLLGDSDGKLHYFQNVAITGQPADFALSQANFANIDVGQFAYPNLIDWDRDGDLDIISGEWSGKLKYYQNNGTTTAPSFASAPTNAALGNIDVQPVCCTGNSAPHIIPNPSTGQWDLLVGTEAGGIHYYPNAETATGTFSPSTTSFGGIRPGDRSTITSGDINGDGKRDWIVGNLRGGIEFFEGDIVLSSAPHSPHQQPRLSVYPNPSTHDLNLWLDAPASLSASIRVHDLHGRLIHSGSTLRGGQVSSLETSSWPDGMYLVECLIPGQPPLARRWVLAR